MFGSDLPAYGAFLRHVDGVDLIDVDLRPAPGESRPPIAVVAAEGVRLNGVTAAGEPLAHGDLHVVAP